MCVYACVVKSTSTINGRLHHTEYRDSTKDVNHWWASKKHKDQIRFKKKKSLYKFGTTSKINIVMGREEYGERKELLMIQNIPPHQWSMVVWEGGIGSLVFNDDVTADKSSRMNSEAFRAALAARIQPNASKLIGLQKQPKECLWQRSGMLCNGQVNYLTWIHLSMHFAFRRQNWRETSEKQAGTKESCSRGLAERLQGWNPEPSDFNAFRLQAVIACKAFVTMY